jgi:large subunit ribosomal protein L22
MEVRSLYRYARISPLKARDVAREIQGLPVSTALDILTFTPRKAAFLIGKTLKSALANAENNHELAVDGLVVKEAVVNDGPTFKRFKPRARGSAGPIRKRTSHITIVLTDDVPAPKAAKEAKEAPAAAAETPEQA